MRMVRRSTWSQDPYIRPQVRGGTRDIGFPNGEHHALYGRSSAAPTFFFHVLCPSGVCLDGGSHSELRPAYKRKTSEVEVLYSVDRPMPYTCSSYYFGLGYTLPTSRHRNSRCPSLTLKTSTSPYQINPGMSNGYRELYKITSQYVIHLKESLHSLYEHISQ